MIRLSMQGNQMHHAEMHEFKIFACVHACIDTCMHACILQATIHMHVSYIRFLNISFYACIHALFKLKSIHLFAQKNIQAPF